VRVTVNTKRVLLKPTFQDFDRRKEDHITIEQFQRVLDSFKLLPAVRCVPIRHESAKDS
jgi:hypothetical protein